MEAFDYYRELRNDLERVHVYSSDNPTGETSVYCMYCIFTVTHTALPTCIITRMNIELSCEHIVVKLLHPQNMDIIRYAYIHGTGNVYEYNIHDLPGA